MNISKYYHILKRDTLEKEEAVTQNLKNKIKLSILGALIASMPSGIGMLLKLLLAPQGFVENLLFIAFGMSFFGAMQIGFLYLFAIWLFWVWT